jgi:tRNA(Arg) A34 adenosine deaminase TadA
MQAVHISMLEKALRLAKVARARGDYPFGAVLAEDNVELASASDKVISSRDPTQHAEIVAISEYYQRTALKPRRPNITIYCSSEPCLMCVGAIICAQISSVVYSVPQEEIQRESETPAKPRALHFLQTIRPNTEIHGPLLLEQGLPLIKGFDFSIKQTEFGSTDA